jgi:lambda repressor-like predicted transcriptional regulator
MHPADIKAAIEKAGSSQAAIASRAGVTKGAVSRVVYGHVVSARIASEIKAATGIPVAQLWPGKYPLLEKLDLMARTRAAIGKQLDTERAAHAAKTAAPKRGASKLGAKPHSPAEQAMHKIWKAKP